MSQRLLGENEDGITYTLVRDLLLAQGYIQTPLNEEDLAKVQFVWHGLVAALEIHHHDEVAITPQVLLQIGHLVNDEYRPDEWLAIMAEFVPPDASEEFLDEVGVLTESQARIIAAAAVLAPMLKLYNQQTQWPDYPVTHDEVWNACIALDIPCGSAEDLEILWEGVGMVLQQVEGKFTRSRLQAIGRAVVQMGYTHGDLSLFADARKINNDGEAFRALCADVTSNISTIARALMSTRLGPGTGE